MSKVSIIATLKEKAIIISSYSNSKAEAIINLNSINEFEGCPSYQNALELTLKQVEMDVPKYCRKEVLIINSSISLCDPGDIFETIEKVKKSGTVCTIISLSAQIYALKYLTDETKGQYIVTKNKEHLQEVIEKYLVPQLTQNEVIASEK